MFYTKKSALPFISISDGTALAQSLWQGILNFKGVESMNRLLSILSLVIALTASNAYAQSAASIVTSVRLANTITGGLMPTSDPLFAQMKTMVEAGDVKGAALLAANSKYFAKYLARRLAFQMQNPAFDASSVKDSDATTFIVAKFVGAGGVKPSISTLFSENATYQVLVNNTATASAALTAAQLDAVDWSTQIVRVDGQQALAGVANNAVRDVIPAKHVGGFFTLSDRANDTSFISQAASDGTNLRVIEGIWQISTGLSLLDVGSSIARVQDVPKFIPQNDPNFFRGQGQAACMSCHGGGMSSANHGYATVADTFNFDANRGLQFIATPTNATRKSLGSDANQRNNVANCNYTANPRLDCNPDGSVSDANQAWDVSQTWAQIGVLKTMGWTGATSGQGLNELGVALGKASIIYEFLTKRVIGEVCPTATFSAADISKIAAAANPFASPAGSDDIRTIVSLVASNMLCL